MHFKELNHKKLNIRFISMKVSKTIRTYHFFYKVEEKGKRFYLIKRMHVLRPAYLRFMSGEIMGLLALMVLGKQTIVENGSTLVSGYGVYMVGWM